MEEEKNNEAIYFRISSFGPRKIKGPAKLKKGEKG